MRTAFHPRLINDPFSDPGLFIPFVFEGRALLFDLGDLSALSPRDLLKVTHVFVTHTHMDHFIGFDTLLRLFLGRDKRLHLYGPPSFFRQIEGKLAGYTWNLLHEYTNDFTLVVTEIGPHEMKTKIYPCRNLFRPEKAGAPVPFSGVLLREPAFAIHGVLLDHETPCLGLALCETMHVNIIKQGLIDLGLPVGPWLSRFKAAVYQERDLGEDFLVTWEDEGERMQERRFPLGELVERIARTSPGQKIAYITDVKGSRRNAEQIVALARDADRLFIEAAFLQNEKEMAGRKAHLTAREAGALAKEAGVRQLELFHFSPRYKDRAEELEREAREAWGSFDAKAPR